MPRMDSFAAPLDRAREGTLELRRGGTRVAVRAAQIDVLCRAIFDGPTPKVEAGGGRVVFEYPRFSAGGLLRNPAYRARIELSAALPWSLVVKGGLGDSRLGLDGLELRGLELHGGAVDLRIVLPRPQGRVRVRIEGGASSVTLLRPSGVAALLTVAGGTSRLAFDGKRYGAIGGETRLETGDAESRRDRYEIEITGGASKLTVAEDDGAAE